ncbi:MAG TPA: ATPase domain-containing protein, partial [Polyangiaceae bacterium]
TAFGIERLDEMLCGGLQPGSVTLCLGTPGSGKTLLGMSLLDHAARKKRKGLHFGFFEAPSELPHKGKSIGLDWSAHIQKGLLHVLWQPPLDIIADALADKLVAEVKAKEIEVLVIDGMLGFLDALTHKERAQRFFGALSNELRSLGVVTLFTDETNSFRQLEFAQPNLVSMFDNVIFMRHLEHGAKVHKLISVPKMRESAGDSSMHEYVIGPKGFVVATLSSSAQSVVADLTPWLSSHERGTFRESKRKSTKAPKAAKRQRRAR